MSEEENIEKPKAEDEGLKEEIPNPPIPANEMIPENTASLAPSALNPQPSVMEVHHHGHVHEKKKWVEYLFQFFMLFLAVFCGFLAEYKLEQTIERHREKEYMISLYHDLSADYVQLQKDVSNEYSRIREIDSVIYFLNRPDRIKWANDIHFLSRGTVRSSAFTFNDRTLVQLRNAGGMRLLTKKAVSDSIVDYYRAVQGVEYLESLRSGIKEQASEVLPKIVDANDFGKVVDTATNRIVRPKEPLKLRPYDHEATNQYIFTLQRMKGVTSGIKNRKRELYQKAKATLELVKTEYQIK